MLVNEEYRMHPATSSVMEEHLSMLVTHPFAERLAMTSITPQAAGIFAGALPLDLPPLGHYPQPRDMVEWSLFEMDPREVIDGVMLDNGAFFAPDPISVGNMRETCPHCNGEPLQLVLRRHHVKRSHLFCPHCTRCYDVLGAQGYSMLDIV